MPLLSGQLLVAIAACMCVLQGTACAAAGTQHRLKERIGRQLLQYTGGTVATSAAFDPCSDSQPCSINGACVRSGLTYACSCYEGWAGANCQLPVAAGGSAAAAAAQPVQQQLGASAAYQLTASGQAPARPDNPADAEVQRALASGHAPDDIAHFRGRAWLSGRILGQRVDAEGVARGSVGHNDLGGVTGVAEASGQFESQGRWGAYSGAGQARAAAASSVSSYGGGGASEQGVVVQGAAGAEASGTMISRLPGASTVVEASGSVDAHAQGSVIVRQAADGAPVQ